MHSFALYSTKRRLSILDELFAIVRAMTIGLIIFMAATFIYREFTYSRAMLFLCWWILILFVSVARFILNRLRLFLRTANKDYANLLLIGTGETALKLIRHIKNDPHWNYNIIGAVSASSELPKEDLDGVPVIGDMNELPDILSDRAIEEVILTIPSIPRDDVMSIIFECEKRMITFRLIADLLGMITSQVDMENIDGVPLLGLKESPLAQVYNRFMKRTLDIACSLVGLLILFPLYLIIAVITKLSSPGPVFYLQKRIGEDKRRFTIIKFRTMVNKAEKGKGAVWTKGDDPRRTRIGAFLRRHNIDEWPQFFNVLMGQMSLVGPRPERPHFVGKFKESIPRYMTRHRIKSGMTGWAQVNGLRGDTSIEERTKYDLYYLENWSIVFDIKILLMTLFTIFFKSENAY